MKSTQSDRGLEFDGVGQGPARGSTKYKHNHWSGHSNDGRLVNYPGQQRDGAMASQPRKDQGPSVTKDRFREAPYRAGSGARPANPDAINVGGQVRNPGGTRSWEPRAGQNYRGNPDSIRVGQSGGEGYGSMSRGSRPVARGATDGINYGPKKQY